MISVDIAVIGGGVTGLASALALAERGASVCLLEREAKPGRATSTHNSGVIHAGLYYPQGSLKARLCVEGRDRLYAFCEQHRVPHARCGKLVDRRRRARNRGAPQAAEDRARQRRDLGRRSVDGDFIKAREPNVRAVAALWSPDTGIVESEALVKTLEHLCKQRDVAVVVGSPLVGATPGADGIELVTPHETLHGAHGGQRGRPLCRRGLGAAGREPLHDLSVPRRVRGAGAIEAAHGERAGLPVAACRRAPASACTWPRPRGAR